MIPLSWVIWPVLFAESVSLVFALLIGEENEGLFNNYDVSVMQDKLKLYRSAIQDCDSSSQHYIKPLKFIQSRINVQCSLFNNKYPVVKFGWQKTVHANSNTPLKHDFSVIYIFKVLKCLSKFKTYFWEGIKCLQHGYLLLVYLKNI